MAAEIEDRGGEGVRLCCGYDYPSPGGNYLATRLAVRGNRSDDRPSRTEVAAQLARDGHIRHRRTLIDEQHVGCAEHRLVCAGRLDTVELHVAEPPPFRNLLEASTVAAVARQDDSNVGRKRSCGV